MDMIKCKKCGFEIDPCAEICSVCGRRTTRKNNKNVIIIISVVVALVFVVGIFLLRTLGDNTEVFTEEETPSNVLTLFLLVVVSLIGCGIIKGWLDSRKKGYHRYDEQPFEDVRRDHRDLTRAKRDQAKAKLTTGRSGRRNVSITEARSLQNDIRRADHENFFRKLNWWKKKESLNSAQRKVLIAARREGILRAIGSLIGIILGIIVIIWVFSVLW